MKKYDIKEKDIDSEYKEAWSRQKEDAYYLDLFNELEEVKTL